MAPYDMSGRVVHISGLARLASLESPTFYRSRSLGSLVLDAPDILMRIAKLYLFPTKSRVNRETVLWRFGMLVVV